MRSSSKRRKTNARDGRLERIKELEEKLATSVPKAEFDTVKSNLQLEMDDLQRRLFDSVPRADLEYVKSELQRICDLQGRYSVRGDETQELRARISELEKLLQSAPELDREQDSRVSIDEIQAFEPRLSESAPRRELEAVRKETENRFTELHQALSESKREADALREKISELESPREGSSTEGSEESEITASEEAEDSEEPESTDSYIQSQVTD